MLDIETLNNFNKNKNGVVKSHILMIHHITQEMQI